LSIEASSAVPKLIPRSTKIVKYPSKLAKNRGIIMRLNPLINHDHIQDIPMIIGTNIILFLMPYSKNDSLNTTKKTIAIRIIIEKYELGLNKTLFKKIISKPIDFSKTLAM
jgi:hypothetical protein